MSFGQALFFGVAGYVIALVGRDLEFSQLWATLPLAMLVGLLLAGLFAAFLLLGRKAPTTIFVALGTLTGSYAAERLVVGLAVCRRRQRPFVGQAAAARRLRVRRGHGVLFPGADRAGPGLCRRALPQAVAGGPRARRHAPERGAAGLLRLPRTALQGAGVLARRHGRGPGRRALQLSPGLHRPRQHGPRPVDDGGDLLPVRRLGHPDRSRARHRGRRGADLRAGRHRRHQAHLAGHPRPGAARRGHVPAQGLPRPARLRSRAHRLVRPAPTGGQDDAAGTDHGAAGDPRRQPSRSAPCGRWRASTSTCRPAPSTA